MQPQHPTASFSSPGSTPVATGLPRTGNRTHQRRPKKKGDTGGAADLSQSAMLERQLWNLITSGQPEPIVRQLIRQLAIDHTEAVGSCHVILNNTGDWEIEPAHATGRLPALAELADEVAAACETSAARQAVQIHQLGQLDNMQALLLPILNLGARPEVLLTVVSTKANIGQTLPALERIVSGLRFWLKYNQSNKADWKLSSLATIVELVTKIECCDSLKSAVDVATNELARHLQCKIAIGLSQSNRVRLSAVSGVTQLNRNTRQRWAFQQVVNETRLRGDEGLVPTEDETDDMLLLAHKQLLGRLQMDAVRSRQLETADSKTIGYIVLAGQHEIVATDRMKKFLDAAIPPIATAIHSVKRAQRSAPVRLLANLPKLLTKIKSLVVIAVMVLVVAVMCYPFTYHVRCHCLIEPVDRRFAVAPFEGLVLETYAKPGDRITQSQVLATMDGRAIRWELAGIAAEREQARKTHEMELAQRDVSNAILAQLDDQRLAARENVLRFQADNLEIRSPIDGIVLSGSPEKSTASSVTTGDLMFEVAPLNPLKIEIAIPADEIPHVKPGMEMQIWIEGYENQTITGTVSQINPKSEIRDATNVFVAEFVIDNPDGEYRPGMKGTVKINSDPHPLAWNLFHKQYEYVIAHWLN